jgi:hypothetical protein
MEFGLATDNKVSLGERNRERDTVSHTMTAYLYQTFPNLFTVHMHTHVQTMGNSRDLEVRKKQMTSRSVQLFSLSPTPPPPLKNIELIFKFCPGEASDRGPSPGISQQKAGETADQ